MPMPAETKGSFINIAKLPGEQYRGDAQPGWHNLFGQLFRGKSILDVGAGLGHSRQRVAAGGNMVTLRDPAAEMPVDIRTDISAVPPKSYDVVTAFDVIEHVVKDAEFVAHLQRIARERVVITTPN